VVTACESSSYDTTHEFDYIDDVRMTPALKFQTELCLEMHKTNERLISSNAALVKSIEQSNQNVIESNQAVLSAVQHLQQQSAQFTEKLLLAIDKLLTRIDSPSPQSHSNRNPIQTPLSPSTFPSVPLPTPVPLPNSDEYVSSQCNVLKEHEDRKQRENGVVICGLSEQADPIDGGEGVFRSDETRNGDLTLIRDLVETGGFDRAVVSCAFRMGRLGGDHPRPLKVRFLNAHATRSVKTSEFLSALRNCPSGNQFTYLRPDLTVVQRRILKNAVAIKQSVSKANGQRCKLRGVPGENLHILAFSKGKWVSIGDPAGLAPVQCSSYGSPPASVSAQAAPDGASTTRTAPIDSYAKKTQQKKVAKRGG
jgi:hypothetical protein